MSFWSAVVLIVLIVTIGQMRTARYRAGQGHPVDRLGRRVAERMLPPEPDPKLESELAELSRRIAVLERIATEDRKGRDIAAEIEALRDRS